MSTSAWVMAAVAALVAGAVWLLVPGTARPRPATGALADRQDPTAALGGRLGASRGLTAGGALVGGVVLLGGTTGLVGGVAAAAAVWWWWGHLEPAGQVARREQLESQLPSAIGLLACSLDAGADPTTGLDTVGRALGAPFADEVARLRNRLDLGTHRGEVWSDLASHPQLGPLGRSLARSHETGSSVAEAIAHLAEELEETQAARVEARARQLEVKVSLPLGVCLLPAFVVLGVLPLVAGLLSDVGSW